MSEVTDGPYTEVVVFNPKGGGVAASKVTLPIEFEGQTPPEKRKFIHLEENNTSTFEDIFEMAEAIAEEQIERFEAGEWNDQPWYVEHDG